ncbi:NADH-quinone oxidoreductase, E subunit [Halobacteroides halobius DSM 5150]|uniref:NADH-quinone oxidoreductase, E subunit n=1 Tax=Halobacteroides halobius (strain ATCC 35273 / DSM 5150 / MD-1) TaxID=748449 RepID=L0KDJ9_HALHC|nr:NADH-quinone oxidoreductase subunit NuoE [Halobacteroides halobius]AGB42163.1 NADH-quinone oxidoreductase, E subunit [Halobacteroides halobius DSM 5150]
MACQCGNEADNQEQYLKPLKKVLEGYEKKEKNLIPVLQDAQNEYGYLPEEVLKEIANQLDLSFSQVYGVTTFYSQFHLEPRGENIIRVCMGTACHVRGGGAVLDEIRDQLGVDDGETTDNLQFTLESVACIGACGLAPVIMVNDDTHGRMTPDKVSEVLEQYK